jgi:hypothetical protein
MDISLLKEFPKRFVDLNFPLSQIDVGHEQLMLFEDFAVTRFDVVANRHAPVLIDDFLAFF